MFDKKDTPRALLSVLDRLIDHRPDQSVEAVPSASQALEALRDAVRRDIEWLMNSRERCIGWPGSLEYIDESVVGYGLPDFSITSVQGGNWRQNVCRQIEGTIRRFEPRLSNVRVALASDGDLADRSARFRIDALLQADPAPEPVSYDSTVEPTTRRVAVVSR